MKNLLLIILFIGFSVLAEESEPIYKAPAQGFSVGDKKGFLIADWNLFPQNKEIYGLYRYGGGMSYLRIGQGLSLKMSGHAGAFLLPPSEGITPVLGLEFMAGDISLNYKNNSEDFYQWTPMGSVGIALGYSKDYYLTLVHRRGTSLGTFGKSGLKPKFAKSSGYSLYFNNKDNGLGYTYTKIGSDRLIESAELHLRNFAIRYEKVQGVKPNKSLLILIRFTDLP